jgi:hypothetical protein
MVAKAAILPVREGTKACVSTFISILAFRANDRRSARRNKKPAGFEGGLGKYGD